MEQQSRWRYSGEETEQHSILDMYPCCKMKIQEVIKSEGGAKNNLFSNEVCINLDKVESERAQKYQTAKQPTVDISFGAKNNNRLMFFLCEFKLRCKNPNNLSKTQLSVKISHSKDLLGSDPSIHNDCIYIFKKSIKNQAKNRIGRLYENKNNFVVTDTDGFKKSYF